MKLTCKFVPLYYGFDLLKEDDVDLCQISKISASFIVELMITVLEQVVK